jgi:hypothetical protein
MSDKSQTYMVTAVPAEPVSQPEPAKKKLNPQKCFSKWLLIQESVLIWIITAALIVLAFYCVINQYFGELPWITAMTGFPWTAYGVSQAFYYRKSEKENTKNGIVFETALKDTCVPPSPPPITNHSTPPIG